MDNKASVKLNSVLNMILSASAVLIALVTYPYLTRVLTPNGVGTVSFARSVISYFTLFAELGMPLYGMRACSRVKEDKEKLGEVVSELLSINIVTHLAVSVALAIAVMIFPPLREIWPIFAVLGFAMLMDALNPIWLFRGIEKYIFITLVTITGKIVTLAGTFLLIKNSNDSFKYACVIAFCLVMTALCDFVYMHKVLPSLPKLGKPRIIKHLKPVIVFFLMSCATTLYTNMDVVMLRLLKSETEVGYYDVGMKVKTILHTVSSSLWTVALPRATGYWDQGDKESAKQFIKKSLHVIYTIQFPLVLFFMFYSNPTVMFLGGSEYTPAVVPMIFIVLSIVPIGISNVVGGEALVGNGKEKVVLISEVAGVICNFILNYILISHYSTLGAALATLITETVIAVIQVVYVRYRMQLALWDTKHFIAPLAGTILGIAVSSFALKVPVMAFFQLAIGGCSFAIVYLIIMLLFKDEIITDIWNTVLSIIKKIFAAKKNRN